MDEGNSVSRIGEEVGAAGLMAPAPEVYELQVARWEGRIRCVYLNDYRIAGGKPWGGFEPAATWGVTFQDIANAVPVVSDLLEALTYGFTLYGYGGPDGPWPIERRREFDRLARAAISKALGTSAPADSEVSSVGGGGDGSSRALLRRGQEPRTATQHSDGEDR
jgi:hypothetical protein